MKAVQSVISLTICVDAFDQSLDHSQSSTSVVTRFGHRLKYIQRSFKNPFSEFTVARYISTATHPKYTSKRDGSELDQKYSGISNVYAFTSLLLNSDGHKTHAEPRKVGLRYSTTL